MNKAHRLFFAPCCDGGVEWFRLTRSHVGEGEAFGMGVDPIQEEMEDARALGCVLVADVVLVVGVVAYEDTDNVWLIQRIEMRVIVTVAMIKISCRDRLLERRSFQHYANTN